MNFPRTALHEMGEEGPIAQRWEVRVFSPAQHNPHPADPHLVPAVFGELR